MDNPEAKESSSTSKFVFVSHKRRIFQKWSKEEDERLLFITADKTGLINWNEISRQIDNRTPVQCSSRYKRIRPGIQRGSWSAEEDNILINYVEKYGKNWGKISKFMKHRNCKQIRDRYLNCLDKNLKRDKFTAEEDAKVLSLYKSYGPIWSKISKEFAGRTGDMIKNRFYSLVRQKSMLAPLSKVNSSEVISENEKEEKNEKYLDSLNFEKKRAELLKIVNEVDVLIDSNDGKGKELLALNDNIIIQRRYIKVINRLFGQNCYDLDDFLIRSNLYNSINICFNLHNKMNISFPDCSYLMSFFCNRQYEKHLKASNSDNVMTLNKEVELLLNIFNASSEEV